MAERKTALLEPVRTGALEETHPKHWRGYPVGATVGAGVECSLSQTHRADPGGAGRNNLTCDLSSAPPLSHWCFSLVKPNWTPSAREPGKQATGIGLVWHGSGKEGR